jgi:hypothetical protein
MHAQQGHLYQFHQVKVMAMKSGAAYVPVRRLVDDGWGLGPVEHVRADKLRPLPMRYFHGQAPG